MPRPRAFSSAASRRRVLPIPASPSISTTAWRPEATRSRASPRAEVSAARPRMPETGASMPTMPMLLSGSGPLAVTTVLPRRSPQSQMEWKQDDHPRAIRCYHLDGGQGGGDALDHLGEDRMRGGEVEPEGSGSARAEGGSVHDGDTRAVVDEHAG